VPLFSWLLCHLVHLSKPQRRKPILHANPKENIEKRKTFHGHGNVDLKYTFTLRYTTFLWPTSTFRTKNTCMNLFSVWICISLPNTLVCIHINISISPSLKFLKPGKGKAIYFLTNKDIRGLFVIYIFKKMCFCLEQINTGACHLQKQRALGDQCLFY